MLGLCLIVLGIFIIYITTLYEIRKVRGISWREVLAFPVGLILGMIFDHFDLPEFLILVGLICIVVGSVMVMGII
ncbi:hypothetical protein COM13_12815 [Bacillus pseudomycoides]|uniref:Uncharacterized protein n=1 Tax=Bacillus pseudomycoides TaxID=64104 RepID=A0AAJ2DLX2_9BACI|nr:MULTISPECIES: hypothetical protein [Bacillus]EEM01611.1 hypothetical protein bmyco0002_60900 [Bacillus pseudomycoides]EEM11295.1 hypothetical protein bmyco0003_19900 [Bacillus pseudomycoides]KFN16327.1 putative membrane protein [Bacillus pseudomycoides]MBD5798083.1 hypothetical protein [Bacillus pseudomycoides]MCX2828346.1 hypothetical protein [Bacillus sp. DHT2]